MRKTIITVVILTVFSAALVHLGQRWLHRPEEEAGPAALSEFSAVALQPIAGVGAVVPVQWAELSFPTGGRLAELTIELGYVVRQGQVLAKLETSELELQVELAQSILELQQANLAQLQLGASEADLEAAQASYEAAAANRDTLKASPSSEEIAIAETDLRQAAIALQRAQAAHDVVRHLPDSGARPELLQLELARIDYQQARAAYELATAAPDQVSLKQAESQVATAWARLEALRENAQESVLQAAEASVIRAKLSLASADRQLNQAILRAPFAGTITSLADVQLGQMMQPGHVILTLADLTQLQVECIDLDEWGAANTKLNQIVDMKVPAQGGRNLRGRLLSVSEGPVGHSGTSALYEATVTLDAQDRNLRWGTKVHIVFGQPDPNLILAAIGD